jgi:hypothetical protein
MTIFFEHHHVLFAVIAIVVVLFLVACLFAAASDSSIWSFFAFADIADALFSFIGFILEIFLS